MSDNPKIFGIGLSKSGSHSLSAFLNSLGFWCVHNPNSNLMSKGNFVSALGSRTAAVDTSVSAHFKQLDKVFPYSAFILTYREDEDTWEKSCTNHFSDSNRKKIKGKQKIRKILFGNRTFKESFRHHHSTVLEHFGTKSKRLLVIDVTDETSKVNVRIFQFLLSWKKYLTQSKVHVPELLKLSLENLNAKPGLFPHIRCEDEYRRQSTCTVRSRKDESKLLFFSGYVRKLLYDNAWGKRYIVFEGNDVTVYMSATLDKVREKYVSASIVLSKNELKIVNQDDGSLCKHPRFVLFGLLEE